jgi:acetolactate synthase-1/2/3 large subunit
VLSLPEDVLSEQSDVQDVDPSTPAAFKPSDASLREINKLLETAERPLLVVGGPNWTESAAQRLRQVCERCSLPVVAAFRSQDVVDNRSSIYAGSVGVGGTPGLAESMGASDLLIAVGTRLDEVTAGAYSTIAAPVPRQRLVHVFPDPLEIGRVFKPILAIACAPEQFITAWASNRVPARDRRWASGLHAAYLRGLDGSGPGAVDLAAIVRYLSEALPEDAIITNGAGNYTAWVHRYYQFKRLNTQLAPVAGAMGFGVPAAIAAKLIHPNRTVVSFAGDGCFLMSSQELATAVQYKLPILVIVINNESYGSIRSHQERRFPGRQLGTDLVNPDFVAYAKSFGAHAERVRLTHEFQPAFERARSSGVPAVLEVTSDAAVRLDERDYP